MLVASGWSAFADEPSVRLRIAWGGGPERQWKGSIHVGDGKLAEPQALGVEADEPGTIWEADGQLQVRERSPRAYNGVDVLVNAAPDAKLNVALTAATNDAPSAVEVRIGDVINESVSSQLDSQGNRVLVMRAPGDKLRVLFDRTSLVFAPGEAFEVEVQPHWLGLPPGTVVRLNAQLTSAATAVRHWSQEFEATSSEPGSPGKPFALSIKLPDAEGVYDLTIAAANPRQWLRWKKTFFDRKVQLVVIDSKPLAGETAVLNKLVEIDPVNPRWWDRLGMDRLGNLPLIPGERKGPLGSGDAARWEHPQLGSMIQLGTGARGAKASWEAYTLPISQPGHPHILEVEYPSDVPQTLGLSIIEPNAAGAVLPIGLDSGVYTADEESENPPQLLKHRLVFWPRTKSPLLLVTNRREGSRALYGKIRVLAAAASGQFASLPLGRASGTAAQLPRAFSREPAGERLLAGYYDRPLIAENFSASEALDPLSHRSLDDWTTFYQAGTRLIEYLNFVGYNGLMLSVVSDGSGLYPSDRLQPTPRHDTGTFFASGQDPVRKDVLEMLFRLFDRQQLRLIPAVHFTGPLPALEALRRQEADDGLNWIGADGAAWSDTHRERSEQTAPYNPLDPRVQSEMLAVVRELVQRYGEHPSFGGIALQLSADGYGQLPTPDGGYDDETIARFERDTHLDVPGEGPKRFAARARYLNAEGKTAWHVWRANQLAALHQRMQQEMAEVRPEARLYLAGATLFEHRHWQRSLRPALPRRMKVDEVLLSLGIRPEAYRGNERIVLLRPQEVTPGGTLPAQGTDSEFNQAPEVDRLFSGQRSCGALFYHAPQRARIASFDAKSPFGAATTYTSLVSEMSPSAERNRRRFVHAIAALDAQQMFDGGWLLPLGQEASLAELISVYRQLPAARFDTLAEESQPVTIRSLTRAGQTYVYLVNDSAWPVIVTLDVDVPPGTRLEKLGSSSGVGPVVRSVDAATWTVSLRPYDMVAARFSAPGVQFHSPKAKLPPQVAAGFERRIRDLSARTAALSTPNPLGVLENPGCEAPPAEDGSVLGWAIASQQGLRPELQDGDAHGGSHSLKLKTSGPAVVLRSNSFAAPTTGRLSVALWLRTVDRARQPSVRLAVEAKYDSGDYYRYAMLGAGSPAAQLTDQWAQFIFPVDDLPTENVAEVRIRLDLLAAGEVWLDDVQLYDLAFAEHERVELTKIITLASYKLQAGQVGDCARILEGYWPQFLLSNVPLVQRPQLAQRGAAEAALAREPAKKPGKLEQIKGYLKGRAGEKITR